MEFRKFYYIYFVLLFLIGIIPIYSQEYNYVVYDVEIDKNRFSKFLFEGRFSAFEKKMFKKMYNEVNKTDLSLTFKKEVSISKPVEKMEIGSTNFSRLSNGGLFILLGIEKVTYLNLNSNTLYRKRGTDDLLHLVKSKITPIKWKITNEEKKKDKFIYKKAIGNVRKGKLEYFIEAWFCSEIPNQFGPDSFYGLPGLITEVYVKDKDFSYSIVLKKIGYNKNIEVNIPLNTFKVYSEEESSKLFRGLRSKL